MTLSDDVSSDFSNGDRFTIRPAATLASIFGADNSAGLDEGGGGAGGADQVWLPNGVGGYDRYYYDSFSFVTFQEEWMDSTTGTVVDPHAIAIYYLDGLTIVGEGNVNTFRVAGIPKLAPVNHALTSSFNYLSTIYPSGSTLATMFGENNSAGLDSGSGSSVGADKVMVPDGAGNFDQYYYDDFSPATLAPGWVDLADLQQLGSHHG